MVATAQDAVPQPLNRQAERYAREGVPLSLSTLADQVGAGAAALMPLFYPCAGCFTSARRRYDGAGPGQGQDRYWSIMDLCAR